ncbi:PQQ-binding-like beta-propeller repeat protein [Actinoplanes sp. NPDC026670]|uniref:outer membrane protein assembly factor BamB family protein n=1 Tax=Actinoplanes sp. NPDC026670 TaxID=3154700 RepID=UPI0033F8136E
MSRRPLTSLLLTAVLLLAGCTQPDLPDLGDGSDLVERWRIPSPVAGLDFTDREFGLIGQDRRLVSVDPASGTLRWSLDLPDGYRITRDSVSTAAGAVVIRGQSGFRVVNAGDGTVLWQHESTGTVVADADGLFLAECRDTGCELSAWDLYNGKRRWTRKTGERVEPVHSGPYQCGCVFLLGERTVSEVVLETGRVPWSMARPRGVTRLIPALYRLILFSPPARPGCAVVLRGTDLGQTHWTREIKTACDVTGPVPGDELAIPVAGGVELVDTYTGANRTVPLGAGETLVADRITWTPGAGYRDLADREAPAAQVPPPSDGRPGVFEPDLGLWLLRSGDGLTLWSRWHGVRWTGPEPAFIAGHDRLVHLDGAELVGVGPAEDAER